MILYHTIFTNLAYTLLTRHTSSFVFKKCYALTNFTSGDKPPFPQSSAPGRTLIFPNHLPNILLNRV